MFSFAGENEILMLDNNLKAKEWSLLVEYAKKHYLWHQVSRTDRLN